MNPKRPNIIYIVCHDLGRELGCYGAKVLTPNLDRFAAGGAIFGNVFCSSPCCSPSRACAMTGLNSHANGVLGLTHRGWPMPESVRTVVDEFNDHGYETAHIGFQHERHHPRENRYQIEISEKNDKYVEKAVPRAIEFLKERQHATKPFYLNIGLMEVHSSQWLDNHFGRQDIYGTLPATRDYLPPPHPDLPVVREAMSRFGATIEYMDRFLGDLFSTIDQLGMAEQTLVIFTTDHGIWGLRSKGTLYDRGTEIALLMRMPGTIPKNIRYDSLIPNIDFAATVLDAAGIPVPSSMHGRSFWPLVTGQTYTPHDAIFIQRNHHSDYDPMRAVRTPQMHYIRNLDPQAGRSLFPQEVSLQAEADISVLDNEMILKTQGPRSREELYDILADPLEFNNLATKPEYAQTLAQLRERLDDWMQTVKDPLLVK